MRKILLTLLALLSLGVSGAWGLEIKFSSDEIKDSSRGGTNPATYYDASQNVVSTTTWCRSFTTNTSVPITFTAGSLDYFTNWYGGFNSNGSLWITASVPSQYVITSVSVKAKIIDGADKSKNMYFEGNTAGKVTLNSDYQTVSSGSLNSSSIRFRLEDGTNSECIIVFEDFTFTINTEVVDAAASINDGHKYRILTHNNGVTDDPSTTYYLTTDGTLTDVAASAADFTFNATTTDQFVPAGYAWKISNGTKRFTNPDGSNRSNKIRRDTQNRDSYDAQVLYKNGSKYAVRATNTTDASWHANAFWTVDADDDASGLPDADYALTLDEKHYVWELEDLSITYNLKFNGVTIASTIVDHTDALNTTAALPTSDWNNPYCTYSYSPSTITASTSVVNITMTWDGPFDFSDNAASATWYFMNIRPDDNNGRAKRWVNYVNSAFAYTTQGDNNATVEETAAWAFVGNPLGVKVLNKASNTFLATGGTMTAGGETWIIGKGSVTYEGNLVEGLILHVGTNNYIHDLSNSFSTWNDGGAATDVGSFLTVVPVEDAITAKIGSWTSGTKWGDCDATTLTAAKADPTIAKYKAIRLVAPDEDAIYRINSESIGGLSISYALVNSDDKIKALSKDLNDVNQLWKVEVPSYHKVKLYNLNAEKYIGSVVNGADKTTPLNETGYEYPISWSESVFQLGTPTYSLLQIETSSGNYGNINAWNTNANWSAEEVTTLPVGLHNIGDYSYATLCLPFDVEISGATAYILKVNGNSASAVAVSQVPAGTGVLLRAVGNVVSATATIISSASADTDGNKLEGTYKEITSARTAGEYILGNNEGVVGFYQRGTGKIGANKAYLKLDADVADAAGVKGIILNFDETGITESVKSEGLNGQIFDLSGRRVNNPNRGLYIMNGKKVAVK